MRRRGLPLPGRTRAGLCLGRRSKERVGGEVLGRTFCVGVGKSGPSFQQLDPQEIIEFHFFFFFFWGFWERKKIHGKKWCQPPFFFFLCPPPPRRVNLRGTPPHSPQPPLVASGGGWGNRRPPHHHPPHSSFSHPPSLLKNPKRVVSGKTLKKFIPYWFSPVLDKPRPITPPPPKNFLHLAHSRIGRGAGATNTTFEWGPQKKEGKGEKGGSGRSTKFTVYGSGCKRGPGASKKKKKKPPSGHGTVGTGVLDIKMAIVPTDLILLSPFLQKKKVPLFFFSEFPPSGLAPFPQNGAPFFPPKKKKKGGGGGFFSPPGGGGGVFFFFFFFSPPPPFFFWGKKKPLFPLFFWGVFFFFNPFFFFFFYFFFLGGKLGFFGVHPPKNSGGFFLGEISKNPPWVGGGVF